MIKTENKISTQKAYLIGLITVVFLTVFNQFLIQKILFEQKFDATVINLAGRQRMLSQKIVKESYQVVNDAYELERLKNQVIQWDDIHVGLQEGNSNLGLPRLRNKNINRLFNEVSTYQSAISSAILSVENKSQLENSLPVILENELIFLTKMDEIVYAFENESLVDTRNLILLEILLAFFSLIVLFIEFRFIFKPLFERIEEENTNLGETISDLSESKGELFKSTQRLDLSIEAINAGIWDWYIPDNTEWWSDKFYTLLGYKPREIPSTYNTFLNVLVHKDDRETAKKALKEHLSKKRKYKIEIRLKTKSGHYRWFESVGQASWDFRGEPIRITGSIIDIEEKKQFEAQIKQDEQMLRIKKYELELALEELSEIQKVAKIGTWKVNLNTMEAFWSDEVYRIHGVSKGTRIKVEDGINYYREDFRPIIQAAIDRAIEEKKSWSEECVLVSEMGKEIWVRAIGYPVFEDDKLVGLRGLFMDIDKERQTEQN